MKKTARKLAALLTAACLMMTAALAERIPAVVFTAQPQDRLNVPEGQTVVFSIDGENIVACKWYYSTDEGQSYHPLRDGTSASFRVTAERALNNSLFFCRALGADGNDYCSNAGRLTLAAEPDPVYFTAQPRDHLNAAEGELVVFSIDGRNIAACQWYFSADEGRSWHPVDGATAGSFGFTAALQLNNCLFYCQAVGIDGKAYCSNAGRLTIARPEPVYFTAQPQDHLNATEGELVVFSIDGRNIAACQWYSSADGGQTYYPADGATAGSFGFTAASQLNNYLFYCQAVGIDGNAYCSNAGRLTVASAHNPASDFTYVLGYDECTITGYRGTAAEVNIPPMIEGCRVTGVGYVAFSGNPGVTRVTIPEGVGSINEGAFSNCPRLRSVAMPDSLRSIGDYAFNGSCNLADAVIPAGVTEIGRSAFSHCAGLTAVTIPDSVTSLGESAFAGCDGLRSVSLSAGLTRIDGRTFSHCASLTAVTIPAGVAGIGEDAFSGCVRLTAIAVSGSNGHYASEDGVLFSKDGKTLVICPGGKTGSYAIPAGVTDIEESAFSHCGSLTGVTIPDSVRRIGANAFRECHALANVTIPASVTGIGEEAFGDCENLTISAPAGSYAWRWAREKGVPVN